MDDSGDDAALISDRREPNQRGHKEGDGEDHQPWGKLGQSQTHWQGWTEVKDDGATEDYPSEYLITRINKYPVECTKVTKLPSPRKHDNDVAHPPNLAIKWKNSALPEMYICCLGPLGKGTRNLPSQIPLTRMTLPDAHTDVEAVKAMLDQETTTPYPIETQNDAEHVTGSSGTRRRSLFGRARSLISNDAIGRIFHLNDTDRVCLVAMLKKMSALILGTAILATPAIILWFTTQHSRFDPFGTPGVESASHNRSSILQGTFRWSVITSLTWAVYWGCDVFFHVLPGLIRGIIEWGILRSFAWIKGRLVRQVERPSCQNACANAIEEKARLSDGTWRSVKHFLAISPYITNVITATVLTRLVTILIGTYDMYARLQLNGKSQAPKWISATFYLLNLPTGLPIFSVAFLLEKWVIQRFAIYFHSKNYERRIEENNFALSTLHIIKSRVKKWRKWQAQQATRRRHQMHHLQSPLLAPISMKDASKDTHSTGESEAIAQDIFDTIRHAAFMCCKDRAEGDTPREFLIEKDFYPFCKASEDATRFARMLDQDGNGDLTRREVLDGISRIHDERDNLTQSLSCSSNYILKLDTLLMTLFLLCASFYWLSLFDASIWHSLTAVGGTALGLKFAFESSASSTFISIIFTLAMHPYDIGDIIILDNAPSLYTVLEVGLWTTTLNGPNGLVYVPNTTLAEGIIGNVRRSEWQLDIMPMRIAPPSDPRMLRPLLAQLESRLVEFAMENPRDYQPNPRTRNLDFESSEAVAFQLVIPYRSNFYDTKLTDERRRRFVRNVLVVLTELGIEQPPVNKDWGRVLSLP